MQGVGFLILDQSTKIPDAGATKPAHRNWSLRRHSEKSRMDASKTWWSQMQFIWH